MTTKEIIKSKFKMVDNKEFFVWLFQYFNIERKTSNKLLKQNNKVIKEVRHENTL
jgi:hypothetical protein